MSSSKKIRLIACKMISTLAYLFDKCGVVVELVTTLACHAGGRGFKSPPSRHFFSVLCVFSHFSSYANAPSLLSSSPHEKVVIIACYDPLNSFTHNIKNKYNFAAKKSPTFGGGDFETMEIIFKSLDVPYEFKVVDPDQIEPLLTAGKADLALGVLKNKDTASYATFPRTPLRTENYKFYGRKQDAKSLDMPYKRAMAHNYAVGIKAGVDYVPEFWKAYPFENGVLNNHLIEYRTEEEAARSLKKRVIDLFISSETYTDAVLRRMGSEEVIIKYQNTLYFQDIFCAFSQHSTLKNFKTLTAQVQKSLLKLSNRDELRKIHEKWNSLPPAEK